ncbi:DNA/RNA helicase domain-containing protein [Streptomyces sp. NBC_01262]|uniref:DNA/RNA helicase domain-containing protein n=1 Tax=Streptomyces sp. NBC_01262 TaxID=2903803 RepID=UPI002E2EB01F|nr:DNA/RNA helicase domain-containing protein [Streptomyces sp. NBC_01262]
MASGTVGEIVQAAGEASFIAGCVQRYTAAGFGRPGEGELRSWRNSWPALLDALVRAGLSDLQLYLEYGTPGGGRRLDALLVGVAPDGALGLVVVELKQWQSCRILAGGRVMRSDGQVTAHPVYQVASYRSFFQHWRPKEAPRLDLRAVVMLHNATAEEGAALHLDVPAVADIPVLTADDLSGRPEALAGLLHCDDLAAPSSAQVDSFEKIRWAPSARLLDHVGSALLGNTTFALVGDQQDAFLRILAAAARHLLARESPACDGSGAGERRGAVITVRGGPGSGKTALAVRLLGHLMRNHPEAKPRLITPSGTLRAHLLEAASGHSAARELFLPATSLRSATHQAKAIVIDEAQRTVRTGGRMAPELAAVLLQVRLAVVFLDERQIIRPDEGTSVAEISSLAQAAGRPHHHLQLTGSFRCHGSKASPNGSTHSCMTPRSPGPGRTATTLGLYGDPFQLQQWIEQATAAGHTTRTTAGFCWPWTRTRPRRATSLPLDITIDVPTGEPATGTSRTWHAAWNAADPLTTPDGTPLAPRSQLWASHTGGHQQVGCIYTAQGLEYHHAGVIIGPDLTWTDNRWTAHPEHSHDPKLRHLTPNRYLPYALNTYRVLLTRGTDTTRIHATHPATQRMLSMPCPLP